MNLKKVVLEDITAEETFKAINRPVYLEVIPKDGEGSDPLTASGTLTGIVSVETEDGLHTTVYLDSAPYDVIHQVETATLTWPEREAEKDGDNPDRLKLLVGGNGAACKPGDPEPCT